MATKTGPGFPEMLNEMDPQTPVSPAPPKPKAKKKVTSLAGLKKKAAHRIKQLDAEDRGEKPETGKPDAEDMAEGEGY